MDLALGWYLLPPMFFSYSSLTSKITETFSHRLDITIPYVIFAYDLHSSMPPRLMRQSRNCHCNCVLSMSLTTPLNHKSYPSSSLPVSRVSKSPPHSIYNPIHLPQLVSLTRLGLLHCSVTVVHTSSFTVFIRQNNKKFNCLLFCLHCYNTECS